MVPNDQEIKIYLCNCSILVRTLYFANKHTVANYACDIPIYFFEMKN